MAIKDIEIKPEKVEFYNAKAHVLYEMNIYVKNLGSASKHVKFLPPETEKFCLKVAEKEKTIASGLQVTALIQYFNKEDADCSDKLGILVDNELVSIILLSFSPKPQLSLVSKVDLGILVADGKSVRKQINIINEGSKCGAYNIVHELKSNFRIYPLHGTIHPGYSQPVWIELISKYIGLIEEEVKVELEAQINPHFLIIKADVVLRSLQLLSCDDKVVDCLRFGYVYYGTDVIQALWLYNNSPQETSFVAILDEHCDGQEVGVDITKSTIGSFIDNQSGKTCIYKTSFFSALPFEGKIDPFQRKKIYFKFSPRYMQPSKSWKSIMRIPSREDFAMFIKIISVGVLVNPLENLKIELAMTGTALPVSLSIHPSQLINFDKCVIGNIVNESITLNNNSPHLPIHFCIKSSAHFIIEPGSGEIDINGAKELVFSFLPKQLGSLRNKFYLDVVGYECEVTSSQQLMYKKSVIKTYLFCCTGIGLFQKGIKVLSSKSVNKNILGLSLQTENENEICKWLKEQDEINRVVKPAKIPQSKQKQKHTKNPLIKERKENDKKIRGMALGTRNVGIHSTVCISMNTEKSMPVQNSTTLDYASLLTPTELHNIIIEPTTFNFGNICQSSVSTKEMTITNNTEKHILIDIKLEYKELHLTSPLSQMVPPKTISKMELVLNSEHLGLLERSVNYIINGHHKGHFLIQANIVKLKLKLSTNKLHLTSVNGMPPESGLRRCVTLVNNRNMSASFSWSPVGQYKKRSFKFRPIKGTVDAFSSLECEVVFYPSYSASFDEDFVAHVENGNKLLLKCSAELGTTSCSFVERHLLFGNIPLNLTTMCSIWLKNDGRNHAYFKVVNPSPLEGMLISPNESVVPAGGFTKLQVDFKPTVPQKFEALLEVDVLGCKKISLRLSGIVDAPNIDISVKSFYFVGVYEGSFSSIPFQIFNLAKSSVEIVFDLSTFPDFKITDVLQNVIENENYFQVSLKGEESFNACLQFHPAQVASYDFILPCSVNHLNPLSVFCNPLYPNILKRVQAIALREPLLISERILTFSLPAGYFDEDKVNQKGCMKNICLKNNSDESIKWSLDISNQTLVKLGRKSVFTLLLDANNSIMHLESGEEFNLAIIFEPTSNCIPFYSSKIPIILHKDSSQVYANIELIGKVSLSRLVFEPEFISFPPVPLCRNISADIIILAQNYARPCELSVQIPSVKFNDGSLEPVLSVEFPDGCQIKKLDRSEGTEAIKLIVKFTSSKPVSFLTQIMVLDGEKSFLLPVAATADNCLLTCSNFLLKNQNDFHIICKEGKKSKNGSSSLFVPCLSAITVPACSSHTSNSSLYNVTYNLSETPLSYSDQASSKVSVAALSSLFENLSNENINSDEGIIQTEISTVQRWFSSQCWSSGPYPIYLPYTLRDNLSTEVHVWRSSNSYLEGKIKLMSVFDLIAQLYGKSIPGIAIKSLLSLKKKEHVKCIIEMYDKMLAFLKFQGAMLSSVKPEYLLNTNDFKYFKQLENSKDKFQESSFELISKKSWSTLLLQIYKIFVLFRISPQTFKLSFPSGYPPLSGFNCDPICSNIYSSSERVILSWLNHHYEQQRLKCWKNAPPSRWVVNFGNDLVDGLVLASVIAAYAPYLIKTHHHSMYTQPSTTEQFLHNSLKVIEMLQFLAIDYDIMATDIIESSPISMLMLCVFLIQNLPLYLPLSNVEFETSLHSSVTKHLKVTNPSNKTLSYQVLLAGEHSAHFHVLKGTKVQVPPKGMIELPVEYTSRFLHSCNCTLLLVGVRGESVLGSTLAFYLNGTVNSLLSSNQFRYASPCYELLRITLKVECPFSCDGIFNVFLVETGPQLEQKKVAKTLTKSLNKKPVFSAFWSASKSIHVKTGVDSRIEVEFLPFELGIRHCSILFSNEKIGDFLYLIEAESTLPLPLYVPFINGPFHVTSAMAMQQSSGMIKENSCTIYLNCDAEKECITELNLDILNSAKEKALTIAARQRMSDKELRRRDVTGMISYQTILSKIKLLQINREDYIQPSHALDINGLAQEYNVEVSSPFFIAPSHVAISQNDTNSSSDLKSIKVPIKLLPCAPGQYNCKVVFYGENDIRVYNIECTVKLTNSFVELEFDTPTHECVVQSIPVVNHSDFDWKLQSEIIGEGFFGPENLIVFSKSTCYYPLSFKPIYEGSVNGSLKLLNNSNGTENIFILRGLGSRPQPLDTIKIECIVNEPTLKMFELKNDLPYKVVFQAFSDLNIITGPLFIPLLSKQTIQIPIRVLALKRGCTEGVVFFVYDADVVTNMGLNRINGNKSDSDSEEDYNCTAFMSSSSVQLASLTLLEKIKRPYRVWFKLNINAYPGKPVKTLFASCHVYSSTNIEISLKNPLDQELSLNVIINGIGLNGKNVLTLPPLGSDFYQITFSPVTIGKQKASVVFQSDLCPEFWYELDLITEEALPYIMPTMRCSLGCLTESVIHLQNHYTYPITYDVLCTNSKSFVLKGVAGKLCVSPSSIIEVNVIFTPSSIGNHQGMVVFQNELNGNQTFIVSGLGEVPELKYYVIHARYGECASTIIHFHNSFDHDVLVKVQLQAENFDFSMLSESSGDIFCSSKADIYIPISYSAHSTEASQCTCHIVPKAVIKDVQSEQSYNETSFSWIYSVQGIPVIEPIEDYQAPKLTCRAREKLVEKIEILLVKENCIGLRNNLSQHSNFPICKLGPIFTSPNVEDHFKEEFGYKLQCDHTEVEAEIQRSVLISLEKKFIDHVSEVVTLVFGFVFFPSKPFCHLVRLVITSPKGGIWKYPFKFVSNEAAVDDVITIQSVGLNKTSNVSFRLNSQNESESNFTAYLSAGTDKMFEVVPQTGVLPPINSEGVLFTVSYRPACYGKEHKTKLIVQSELMQWVYEVRGVTPEYQPPKVDASVISHHKKIQKKNLRKNFVQENLRLSNTGGHR